MAFISIIETRAIGRVEGYHEASDVTIGDDRNSPVDQRLYSH
jgi:hypothetical protein